MIPHSKPTIDENDILAISDTLRSGNIAQGDMVKRFEQELAKYINARDGVATSSGTAALHLALLALNITREDIVALPSYVCTAVLNVVNYIGASPLLVDIRQDTFNLDIEDLKIKLTPGVKAIVVPHTFGLAADMDEIKALGIPVIEDCAQSVGTTYKNKMTGSLGDIAIFSFYATKMITTGEGGMVVSDSEKLLDKVRDLRDYDNKENYTKRYNYKMTDIQASLGLSQLKKLHQFIELRRRIAQRYNAEFTNLCSLPIDYSDNGKHIYYRYVIKLHQGLERFLKLSKEKGINCRKPVFKPLHQYLHISGFDNTNIVYEKAVSIPIYPTLTEQNVSEIVDFVKNAIKKL